MAEGTGRGLAHERRVVVECRGHWPDRATVVHASERPDGVCPGAGGWITNRVGQRIHRAVGLRETQPQRRDAPHRGVGRRAGAGAVQADLVATLRAEQPDGKLADARVSRRKVLEEKPDVVGGHVVATMAARVSGKPSAERRHRSVTEGAAPAAAHGVGGQPAHRGGGAPRSGDQLPDIVRRGTHDGRAPWLSPQHADDGEERDGGCAAYDLQSVTRTRSLW